MIDAQTGESGLEISPGPSAPDTFTPPTQFSPFEKTTGTTLSKDCSIQPAGETPCSPETPIPVQASSVSINERQVDSPTPPEQDLFPEGTPPTVRTAPVIGGADKIAFFNMGEIWAANLDGSELEQLTRDGLQKFNLQWAPDGKAVNYISGNCVYSIALSGKETEPFICFQTAGLLADFAISPEGKSAAISLDHELYIVPYDLEKLALVRSAQDLRALAVCPGLDPYTQNGKTVGVKLTRWSTDGKQIAISRQGLDGDRLVDLIQILEISECRLPVPRLDEFPAKRFQMDGYETHPVIQNFSWDGGELFALFNYKRNHGFGDLWIYSTTLRRANQISPIDGACCYRDPQWSPDGRYLLFAFQDIRAAPDSLIRLYYVALATIGTGLAYPPLPLPADFFTDPHAHPEPVLRPAQ